MTSVINDSQKFWSYLRPQVRKFAIAMEERLQANDSKGGWDRLDMEDCLKRLKEESIELEIAVGPHIFREKEDIRKEEADVGNFAMFIVDNLGELR